MSAPLDTAAAQVVQAVIRAYLAEQHRLDAADVLVRAALPILGWQRQAGMHGNETEVVPTLWIGERAAWLLAALGVDGPVQARWYATRNPATVLLDITTRAQQLATLRFDRATQADLLVWIAYAGTISLVARDDVPPFAAQGTIVACLAAGAGTLLETDRVALQELEQDAADHPRA
jgi:hypothetical protein